MLFRSLDGYAPRDEQEARIYGMKRGLEFIANRQNRITEENLHYLYQISTGDYLPDEDRLLPNHFYRHGEVFIVGGEEPRPGLPDVYKRQTLLRVHRRRVERTNRS